MKNTLPVFAVIVTACAVTLAQGAPAETAAAAPAPRAASAESPGLLKKIFGSRQGQRVTFPPAATPAPKIAPTPPAAKPKVKP